MTVNLTGRSSFTPVVLHDDMSIEVIKGTGAFVQPVQEQRAHPSRPEITREAEAVLTAPETKLRPIRIPMFLRSFGRECLPSAGLGQLEASWVRLPVAKARTLTESYKKDRDLKS
jgi:hypothetical protein